MIQNSTRFTFGLNIHLLSFTLPRDVMKDKDDIRVSITTMPEESKQHFHLRGKKTNYSNHIFSLNVTNQTKRIIMVFRKKHLFADDPIIASSTIHMSDFSKFPRNPEELGNGAISTDVKTLNVYYPLQKQIIEENRQGKNISKYNIKRKVLGQMQIQLSFTTPYASFSHKKEAKENRHHTKIERNSNDKNQSIKMHKTKKNKQKGEYEQIVSSTNFNIN